jgi:hypothetical protein
VDTPENSGWTLLHQASSWGHLEFTCFLVEHGADAAAPNNYGWTPFHMASERGHLGPAQFLVEEHVADVGYWICVKTWAGHVGAMLDQEPCEIHMTTWMPDAAVLVSGGYIRILMSPPLTNKGLYVSCACAASPLRHHAALVSGEIGVLCACDLQYQPGKYGSWIDDCQWRPG